MIDTDILRSIAESELRNWVKVNGYDDSWFDTIYEEWLAANQLKTNEPTT